MAIPDSASDRDVIMVMLIIMVTFVSDWAGDLLFCTSIGGYVLL